LVLVVFQLPLSGSPKAFESVVKAYATRIFQLPLSGSHEGRALVEEVDPLAGLSTPSLGITWRGARAFGWRVTLLSTPSLGITGGSASSSASSGTLSTPSLGITTTRILEIPHYPQGFQLPLSGSRDHGEEVLLRCRRQRGLSTPSLGITHDGARSKSRCGSPFNSLSRDHKFLEYKAYGKVACRFQLPLSGSQHQANPRELRHNGQTFNSLSRDHRIFGSWGSSFRASAAPFNSLSRDHNVDGSTITNSFPIFQLPLSGSQGTLSDHGYATDMTATFNSLSRDHDPLPRPRGMREPFGSLSTPSLGITRFILCA